MDDFKDFFKDLRDRVSNPFFTSFIISWLLTNWPITIAIIFYDDADVKSDGFRSLYQLIKFYATPMTVFVEPFFWAIVVTYSFPYVKSIIKLHSAEISAKNETDILAKTKAGSMPLAKFIKLRNAHIDTINVLEKLNEEESQYLVENANLKKDNEQLKLEKIKIQSEYGLSEQRFNRYKELSRYGMTNGKWQVNFTSKDGTKRELILDFSDDIVRESASSFISYSAYDLVANPFQNTLYFFLRPEDGQDPIGPVSLEGSSSHEYFRLKGIHPTYDSFTMSKIQST
ncbi:hypothetical protein [Pedobacter agri]|uniref:Uncharacterized protein n=1 Tax=Pedobacter agri TaxID=454586 RepID=A0A9X3DES1_9SPHI|nr:hypothetical protein [Pedobacter agri]MCX3264801.1 hypothetical protein [Pedobacter agri]